ncbi:MAG: hypothetical protein ACON4R_05675 [Akkermansiaceae bacterium]
MKIAVGVLGLVVALAIALLPADLISRMTFRVSERDVLEVEATPSGRQNNDNNEGVGSGLSTEELIAHLKGVEEKWGSNLTEGERHFRRREVVTDWSESMIVRLIQSPECPDFWTAPLAFQWGRIAPRNAIEFFIENADTLVGDALAGWSGIDPHAAWEVYKVEIFGIHDLALFETPIFNTARAICYNLGRKDWDFVVSEFKGNKTDELQIPLLVGIVSGAGDNLSWEKLIPELAEVVNEFDSETADELRDPFREVDRIDTDLARMFSGYLFPRWLEQDVSGALN